MFSRWKLSRWFHPSLFHFKVEGQCQSLQVCFHEDPWWLRSGRNLVNLSREALLLSILWALICLSLHEIWKLGRVTSFRNPLINGLSWKMSLSFSPATSTYMSVHP